MNLREEIIYNKNFDSLFIQKEERKKFDNFAEAFNEDIEEYGKEKAIMLYSMLFGLELTEDASSFWEELANKKNLFLKKEKLLPSLKKMGAKIEASQPKGIADVAKKSMPSFWDKIKGSVSGNFSSIKDSIKHGDWKSLFRIPLFKGALVAGGIGALLLVLKKIFGKKKIEAEESLIKEKAIEAGYTK